MGAKYFAEQVNKLTGGRVEIQVFTGGELVGSANILKAVRNGMIDIGHGMGHHFTERKTGLLESGLPMSWMSAVEADVLYERRGLKKLFGDDYAKLGVVYLGPTWAAPYHTLSKRPIRSLDEMRKMKIRAVGATAKMLSAVGVNVVNLPPEDIYMALTTGQIDGVVYGSAAEYKETKFYEVAGWLNVTPLIDPITDTLIINKKLWESLPEDIRGHLSGPRRPDPLVLLYLERKRGREPEGDERALQRQDDHLPGSGSENSGQGRRTDMGRGSSEIA